MRLQIFLSHNGICSRREAMKVILDGRVSVNGIVLKEPSQDVNPPRDQICFDGRRIQEKEYEYLLLNKPQGYVTTKKDRFAPKTVFDLLPQSCQHVSPVGRLDKDTQGLLLLTNDGGIAYKLTHPKFNIDKTYLVRILGKLERGDQCQIEEGVFIENKKTAPARINNMKHFGDETELMITIHEGRKRQIRLMFAKIGKKITLLKRISQGPLNLGALKTGEYRRLNKNELEALRAL